MDCLVGSVAQGTADADRVIVAQVTSYLTYNHGNCVSGKLNPDRRIEVVDGLDQADTADLKQIIYIFVIAGKRLMTLNTSLRLPLI